jgi:hypothetical protein
MSPNKDRTSNVCKYKCVGVQNTRPGRAPKIKEMTNWLEVAVLARFAGLKPSLLQLLSRVWRCNRVHSVLRQQHPKDFLAIRKIPLGLVRAGLQPVTA